MQAFNIVVVENNDEEPYEGYFAYMEVDFFLIQMAGGYGAYGPNEGPYPTRGYGENPFEAIACLMACLAEENDHNEEWMKYFVGG